MVSSMDNKDKKPLSDSSDLFAAMGAVGSLGFTLVLATFAGLGLGILIDRFTGLKPWFTIGGLLFGIVSGFVKIYAEAKKKM